LLNWGLRHVGVVLENLVVLYEVQQDTKDIGRDPKHIGELPVVIRISSVNPGKMYVPPLCYMSTKK
jgi:hypothetical protein